MQFSNATALDSPRLQALFERHTAPYGHDGLTVRVRYSRSSPFSGTCFYRDGRIFINLGRQNAYPFSLVTHAAKARGDERSWWREAYRLTIADAYQLALFIYLHELFHYLVKQAGRSPRRKEAMCDRFAARVLVDEFGCPMTTRSGRPAPRWQWDFQDLDAFVAGARVGACKAPPGSHPSVVAASPPRPPIPVVIHGLSDFMAGAGGPGRVRTPSERPGRGNG